MTNAVAVTFPEMERLAVAIAKSNLFGMKTPEQALALMAIAQAEGQHPALAARDYHVIDGRPSLKADAMLARFQAAGGKMEMIDYSDAKVSAKFTHAQGGSVTIEWTTERANTAGLRGKKVWQQYPRQMLRARVISEGVRTVFPGAVVGMLTPEEAIDVTPDSTGDHTMPPAPLTGIAALQERVAKMAPASMQVLREVLAEEIDAGKLVADDFALTPPSVEDQILAQLRDTALEGPAALKTAWEGLTKDMRKAFAPHLDSLKEAAAKAEQAAARG